MHTFAVPVPQPPGTVTHQPRRRRRRSPTPDLDAAQQEALTTRRRVYQLRVRAKHCGSNRYSEYSPVDPRTISTSPVIIERLRTFMRRDLSVLLPLESDVEFVLRVAEGMIKRYPIQSDTVINGLRSFLHDDCELFVHELACFTRSRLTVAAYDSIVQYDWPEP